MMSTPFQTTNNPNLTCINVDDTTYSNSNWTNIDPQSYFSNNCSGTTDIKKHMFLMIILRIILKPMEWEMEFLLMTLFLQ